jgi:hypothetical protein
MDRRYQVFLSSTYEDLKEERLEVMKALLELDCIPAGMEYFPAGNEEAWSYVTDLIDDCDYYVVVLGGRYGSTDSEGVSFTEREYRYAIERGVPVAAFLHANPDEIIAGKSEKESEKRQRLEEFRALCRRRLCKEWSTAHELGAVVSRSMTQLIRRNPRPGWVRADALATEEATRQILDLRERIERQADEIERLSQAAPEEYEQFAQGEDAFTLEIRVTLYKEGAAYRDPDRLQQVHYRTAPSWNELFSFIAPRIIDGGTESQVRGALNSGLKDMSYAALLEQYPAHTPKSASAAMGDVNTILLQFVALDLIVAKTEIVEGKNGPKERRTWELTPRGRRYMLQTLAVRRPPVEAPDDAK